MPQRVLLSLTKGTLKTNCHIIFFIFKGHFCPPCLSQKTARGAAALLPPPPAVPAFIDTRSPKIWSWDRVIIRDGEPGAPPDLLPREHQVAQADSVWCLSSLKPGLVWYFVWVQFPLLISLVLRGFFCGYSLRTGFPPLLKLTTYLGSTGPRTVIGTCWGGYPALVAKLNKKITKRLVEIT